MIDDSHERGYQFQMIALLAIAKMRKHFRNELLNISMQIVEMSHQEK